MAVACLLVPNYTRETFRKVLAEYPNFPQELLRDEKFIVNRVSLYGVPTFYKFSVEFGFFDGVTAVLARKIDRGTTKATPQLEDKVSVFKDETHLGSARIFKVINSEYPFRLVESEIIDRDFFRDYLVSVCHLAAYCAKTGTKGVAANLVQVLNHAASVATVACYCLAEEDPALATSCRDIIVTPLPRCAGEPRQSIEIRYAGQG